MVTWIASVILEFIYAYSDVSPALKDIYQYGIEITLSSILNIALVMIASLIVGDIFAGVLFLSIFIFVRSFTGGYHAHTYFRCNAFMVLTFLLSYYLYNTLSYFQIDLRSLSLVAILNLIPIIWFSPVPNIHKLLTFQARKRSRFLAIVISLFLLLCGLFLVLHYIAYGYLIIVTISAISVMMITEILLQRRRENES